MGHSLAYVNEPVAAGSTIPAYACSSPVPTQSLIAGDVGSIARDVMSAASHRRGGLAPWQVRRVHSYIAANLEKRTRIADLAAVSHLSASHFAHAFRMSFDAPPGALIRSQRLDHARQMLIASNLSLAEIAVACGFADQAHMSRLFRRDMDMPPGKWRGRRAIDAATAKRSIMAEQPQGTGADIGRCHGGAASSI